MSRIGVILGLMILLAVSTVCGFDGNRKGFVLGGGAGVVPVCHWKVIVDFFDLNLGEIDENRVGAGLQFVIGGAFDEHNMLVYEGNVSGFTSELLDESVGQGFNGAAWYHYFGDPGKTAFTTLGVGLYYFKIGDYDPTNAGGALLLGGGYEFSRHWQVGVYLTFGKTSDSAYGLSADFEHANLSILFSGIAY